MKPVEVLTKARELIKTRGWTQGEAARDVGGGGVSWKSKNACRFCAYGAMWRAGGGVFSLPVEAAERALERVINASISEWNDEQGRTRAQILKAFDKAIKLATEQSQ